MCEPLLHLKILVKVYSVKILLVTSSACTRLQKSSQENEHFMRSFSTIGFCNSTGSYWLAASFCIFLATWLRSSLLPPWFANSFCSLTKNILTELILGPHCNHDCLISPVFVQHVYQFFCNAAIRANQLFSQKECSSVCRCSLLAIELTSLPSGQQCVNTKVQRAQTRLRSVQRRLSRKGWLLLKDRRRRKTDNLSFFLKIKKKCLGRNWGI